MPINPMLINQSMIKSMPYESIDQAIGQGGILPISLELPPEGDNAQQIRDMPIIRDGVPVSGQSMPSELSNAMFMPEPSIPQMPQMGEIAAMFQRPDPLAGVAQSLGLSPQQQAGFSQLVGGLQQLEDSYNRANLPASVYLKMKEQEDDAEIKRQAALVQSLQLESDLNFQRQTLEMKREELAMERQKLYGEALKGQRISDILAGRTPAINTPDIGVMPQDQGAVTIPDTNIAPLPLPMSAPMNQNMSVQDKMAAIAGIYSDNPTVAMQALNAQLEAEKANKASKEGSMKNEMDLRKEFEGLPDVKTFREQEAQIRKIKQASSNPSAANDIALIFSYMKMLDPASVVREGEFATAEQAAGVPDRILKLYNKAVEGERLNDSQRQQFLLSAQQQFDGSAQLFNERANQYKTLANQYGFNPDRIVAGIRSEENKLIKRKKYNPKTGVFE